jgi:hypothetical protein
MQSTQKTGVIVPTYVNFTLMGTMQSVGSVSPTMSCTKGGTESGFVINFDSASFIVTLVGAVN